MPVLYILSLIVLFSIDLSDNYAEDAPVSPGANATPSAEDMFEGIGPMGMGWQGTVRYQPTKCMHLPMHLPCISWSSCRRH